MSLLLHGSFESEAAPAVVVLPPTLPVATPFTEEVLAADRAIMELLGGVPVLYAPEVGEPVPVTGMFGTVAELAKSDVPVGVEVLGPAVFLRLEDLPVDPEDDEPTLTINGADYKVTGRILDDVGGIVLALRLR